MLAQIPRFYIPTVIRKPLLKTEIDVSFSEIGFSPTPPASIIFVMSASPAEEVL
jgi:hypothetical protein